MKVRTSLLALTLALAASPVSSWAKRGNYSSLEEITKTYKDLYEDAVKYDKALESGKDNVSDLEDRLESQKVAWKDYWTRHKKYEKEINEINEDIAKDEEAIHDLDNKIDSLVNKVDETNKEVTEYRQAHAGEDVAGRGRSKAHKKYRELSKKANEAEKELAKARKKIKDVKERIIEHKRAVADLEPKRTMAAERVDAFAAGYHNAKAKLDKAKSEYSEKYAGALKNAASIAASKLLMDIREDSHGMMLLLANIKTLEQSADITGLKLQALKEKTRIYLDNSLLGDYVNSSFSKNFKEALNGTDMCNAVYRCNKDQREALGQLQTTVSRVINELQVEKDRKVDEANEKAQREAAEK